MKRVFYGWWVVLACSLRSFYVAGVIFFGFTAFFEPIAEEFAWSYTQISFAVRMVLLIVRLIDLYQWRTTLIILGLGMWAIGIPLSLVIRNRPEDYGYRPDGEMFAISGQSHEIQDREVKIGLKEAFKMRTFLYLNLVEALRMMTLMAVFTHVMPYLSSVGLPRSSASIVAGAIPLIGIIGRFGFGWLGDFYDKRHVMALTLGLIILGIQAFSFVHVRWVIIPFLLLFPLGHGGSMVLRGSILREYFGRNSFGKMLGIIMGSASIGGIVGPTLAGRSYDTWGSYQLIWHVYWGLLIIAFTLTLKMKPVTIKS